MTRLIISLIALFAACSVQASQIPTKFLADKAVTAGKLSSGAASSGAIATADGSGGVSYVAPSVWSQDAFFTCNGSTTAFTLSYAPAQAAAVIATVDGTALIQGAANDYTVSGTTLTLTSACATGQKLLVIYLH